MPITPTTRGAVLALSAFAVLSTAPVAYAAYYADQPVRESAANSPYSTSPDIIHITGGVGENERMSMEEARGDYNVHVLNSTKDGAFVDEAHLTITDKAGTQLVSADAGPLFYVILPTGNYTITADYNGQQQSKKLKVTKSTKALPVHFTW